MKKSLPASDNAYSGKGRLVVYESENGRIKIDVQLENETVWLTQQLIADLFQTTKQNIGQHLGNIFSEGEVSEDSVVKKFFTTAGNGKNYKTSFYNLDAIISVGYRVKSYVATRFRQWATQKLREYIVKGFVLDDERLKNPDQPFDYFEELLRRIQDIRTSERRFYQKITDIYATSADYDPTQEISIDFFKTVQNKMHWAITGMTAAEIIHIRADAGKPNMGLTNWRGSKVRKTDVATVEIKGVDVYDPTTGQIRSASTDDIACWFIDTEYNGESFFVRHACFTGADEPYEKLKRALRGDIDEAAWSSLYSTVSRPFDPPATGKIAVKVINHYGDEVLKVYEV